MSTARFDAHFVNELSEILRSEAEGLVYDAKGKATPHSRPFTGEWELRSVGLEPHSAGTRVTCRLHAGDSDVIATIDAADFPGLVGKRSHDPGFNTTEFSDLAVLTSLLIQEQITTFSPSGLTQHRVRIRLPKDRDDET